MNHGMNTRRRSPARIAKVTISLRSPDLAVMRRLAKRRHGGNLSGAFAEVIGHAARLEAMDLVLAELPAPSAEGLSRLEAELTAPLEPARPRRRGRKKKKAA